MIWSEVLRYADLTKIHWKFVFFGVYPWTPLSLFGITVGWPAFEFSKYGVCAIPWRRQRLHLGRTLYQWGQILNLEGIDSMAVVHSIRRRAHHGLELPFVVQDIMSWQATTFLLLLREGTYHGGVFSLKQVEKDRRRLVVWMSRSEASGCSLGAMSFNVGVTRSISHLLLTPSSYLPIALSPWWENHK